MNAMSAHAAVSAPTVHSGRENARYLALDAHSVYRRETGPVEAR